MTQAEPSPDTTSVASHVEFRPQLAATLVSSPCWLRRSLLEMHNCAQQWAKDFILPSLKKIRELGAHRDEGP